MIQITEPMPHHGIASCGSVEPTRPPFCRCFANANVYDETGERTGDVDARSAVLVPRPWLAAAARSKFGVVVLSASFFERGWPEYELDGLVTMAVSGKQVLLPLWHGVSKDQVVSYSPSLADRVALRTSDYTIEEIAGEITAVIRPTPSG